MFSKWRPMEAAILKQTLKRKIIKLNLFLKNVHNHTHMTNVSSAYYANNHFMEVFYESYTLSEPEFYGDLVYKFKTIVCRVNFSDQFKKKYRTLQKYWI